jgi:hypothetical protein
MVWTLAATSLRPVTLLLSASQVRTGATAALSATFVGTPANSNTIQVVIDSAGQLGTPSSSRRFKKQIQPMDSASEAILALKPVTQDLKSKIAEQQKDFQSAIT